MSLEELEKKLYGLDRKEDGEHLVEAIQVKKESPRVASDWATEDEAGKPAGQAKKGTAKWIVIGSLLALAIVGSVAYYYISAFYKTKDLVFDAATVDAILIAQPFDITVTIENRSQVTLRDGKVFVTLPDGIIAVDAGTERQAIEDSVGDLSAGDMIERTYSVVVVKDEQSTKKLDVNFSYLPQKINTRFEREETLEVRVGQPAISLDFTTPQNVFSTENFDAGMRYRNISTVDFSNAQIRLIIPPKVALKSASVKADIGDATWVVGQLKPQEEKEILVKGIFEGASQEFFELKSQVVVMINGREYVINEKTANIGIAASPLSLEIVANNDPAYVAKTDDTISYVLKYKNNTDVGLSDAIVVVKLRGEMFDMPSVRSRGSFNSITNVLTWNASAVPELKLIAPGAEGSVDFSIQTKQAYPIKRLFDKNYLLRVAGEINSPTVPYAVASDRTVGFAESEVKVGGNIELFAKVERLPGTPLPQANRASKYTITLTLKNYATDMRDIKILSSLQPGVTWTGNAKGSNGSVPVFNDRTGEIAWTIDKVVATKGVIGSPTEATFQIEIMPNITQTGTIDVTKDFALTAVDDFTGAVITRQVRGLQTSGIK